MDKDDETEVYSRNGRFAGRTDDWLGSDHQRQLRRLKQMDYLQPRHQTTNIMTIFASSAQTSASCALKTGSLNAEEAKVDTEVAEVRPWTKTTKLKFILAMAGLLGGLVTGWGATTNVSFGAYFFNPKSVTINVRDTVSCNGIFHTMTVPHRPEAAQF